MPVSQGPILDLEEKLKIIETVHRFQYAVDRVDAAELASFFTEDGVLEVRGYERGLPSVMRGQEELEAGLRSRFGVSPRQQLGLLEEKETPNGSPRRRHYIANVVVTNQSDANVNVMSNILLTLATDDSLKVVVVGHYDDELTIGEDHDWRFQRRVLTLDVDVW